MILKIQCILISFLSLMLLSHVFLLCWFSFSIEMLCWFLFSIKIFDRNSNLQKKKIK